MTQLVPHLDRRSATENHRLNTLQIPLLRFQGFMILSGLLLLSELLVTRTFTIAGYLRFIGIAGAYCTAAWLVMRYSYNRFRSFDLGLMFLFLDIPFVLAVIHRTGANNSLLFFLLMLRVTDQTSYTDRNRIFAFGHITAASYGAYVFWLMSFRNVVIDWRLEALKLAALFGANLYIALTSQPGRRLRSRSMHSARVARRLNRRLQRRSVQLEEARAKAEAASRAKSDFLATMSHEVRTPMNAIIGMTELALHTELSAEQRRYLETVKSSADSMIQVINDVLDFSKIEAGKLDLHPVPFRLREALGQNMSALGVKATEKNLELASQVARDVPEWIVGDPNRLGQILTNLIGNAIKFTDFGVVFVLVQLADPPEIDPREIRLQFTVRDTGIGIPRDKQQMIFESFVQADGSMTRKYGGTGLGLSIASRLVGMMSGRIWVESEPSQGSTFFFTAQFGKPTSFAGSSQPDAIVHQSIPTKLTEKVRHPLRVLLAEDNAVNQQLAVEMLRMRGHSVQLAGNGAEVLEALKRESFDVVLMDVQMPGMDGFQTTAAIRERERKTGSHLPIVALTGYAMKGDRERCLDAGMDAYLCKPIRSRELFQAVEQFSLLPQIEITKTKQ